MRVSKILSTLLVLGITMSVAIQSPISINADETKKKATTESKKEETVKSEYEKAYSRKTTDYTIYYMFDTDDKSVVSFRSGGSYIMEGTYSGKFSETVKITWAKKEWKEELSVDKEGAVTLVDGNELDWEYKTCDVSKAQKALNKITESKETKKKPSKAARMAVNYPKRSASDISISTLNDYAHVDTDVVRLGNDEGATITISSSTKKLILEDLVVDYDDSLIDVELISESQGDKSGTIKLYINGLQEGVSEIFIMTWYDLLVKGEEAEGYSIPVKKFNSTDGQIVYLTPTGEKYHISQECAGENATKTTLNDALCYEYKPCGNCAG